MRDREVQADIVAEACSDATRDMLVQWCLNPWRWHSPEMHQTWQSLCIWTWCSIMGWPHLSNFVFDKRAYINGWFKFKKSFWFFFATFKTKTLCSFIIGADAAMLSSNLTTWLHVLRYSGRTSSPWEAASHANHCRNFRIWHLRSKRPCQKRIRTGSRSMLSIFWRLQVKSWQMIIKMYVGNLFIHWCFVFVCTVCTGNYTHQMDREAYP